MKSVKVVLDLTVDPDVWQEYLDRGYDTPQILRCIEDSVSRARIELGLIHDFCVDSVKEVKEVKV
jgi:hypothetical protein